MNTTTILDCGHAPSETTGLGTGYGVDSEGKKYCHDCCAARELTDIAATGKATLYLSRHEVLATNCGNSRNAHCTHKVTDWPGKLVFYCGEPRKSRHNIARWRYDVWFRVPNDVFLWHGVQYGDNTQIVHCKRTKQHCL